MRFLEPTGTTGFLSLVFAPAGTRAATDRKRERQQGRNRELQNLLHPGGVLRRALVDRVGSVAGERIPNTQCSSAIITIVDQSAPPDKVTARGKYRRA